LRFERLQEDVVERQSEGNVGDAGVSGHIGPWQSKADSPRGGEHQAR